MLMLPRWNPAICAHKHELQIRWRISLSNGVKLFEFPNKFDTNFLVVRKSSKNIAN
uniref:Uncharacterized protein n=1 Tax=Arundo donax TaxID=35708 RepID=A0A0A8ZNI2_ARUDO